MRSSTPKPKPVKKKIKKNVKRRPVRVPQHALERLPNDYIVVRGNGGGLARPPRLRAVGAPAPGPATLDPTGRPVNNGTAGLPVADFYNRLGSGMRSASRAFVSAGVLLRNLGHHLHGRAEAPSGPASTVGTETTGTDFYSEFGDSVYSDPEDFDDDMAVDLEAGMAPPVEVDLEAGPLLQPPRAPAPEPAPAPAPAPATAPAPAPAPANLTGTVFRGVDITNVIETEEELISLREQVDLLNVQLAGRPTPEQMNELRDRVEDLQQQLIDAQQVVETRPGPSDQTNVQELRDRIANLQDSLTTAMRTVAVVEMVPIDGQPGQGGGGGGNVDQTRRIQELHDLARELTDEINNGRDRIRDLEDQLYYRPTTERFEQTAQQVIQLQEALARENEHILRMQETLAAYRAQAVEARRRRETARSIGVGTDTPQTRDMQVGPDQEEPDEEDTPEPTPTRDAMTNTPGQIARRAHMVPPGQNQNTPSMREFRAEIDQRAQQRRRPNESGRPRDAGTSVPERPAVVRRLFRDPPADTNNPADDVPTAGATATREEFVPAQPAQHLHPPAAPGGGRAPRVPRDQQLRNAAFGPNEEGRETSRGRRTKRPARYNP